MGPHRPDTDRPKGKSGKRKRSKIQCEECGDTFDDDYRLKHNQKYHMDMIKSHTHIKYKMANAPRNPFEAAKKKPYRQEAQTSTAISAEPTTEGTIMESVTTGDLIQESGDDKDGNYHQIVQLLGRHVPILRRWLSDKRMNPYHVTYLSPQSQKELISLLETELRQRVVDEVHAAWIFSVMADTTPDESPTDLLSVVVSHYNVYEKHAKQSKNFVENLQKVDVNVLDAAALVEATMKVLDQIRSNDKTMTDHIEASCNFAKQISIDPERQFSRHHHQRKVPRRLDDRPDTSAHLKLHMFCGQQFKEVLDVHISRMREHLVQFQDPLKPLFSCLKPPIDASEAPSIAAIFPPTHAPDPLALMAELQV
ncbi:hypothetical protein HOLleu_02441 [Holothuria leucospilota]|uniref:C2H2-type domain-containing protein n=1 Tax=Holothuria leucospilota TaxID=206669 RepID=A0A9Q1HLF1_HOLLE|nr:hypothetical protein HOLleu_02441 [Holothuria leucospilota]